MFYFKFQTNTFRRLVLHNTQPSRIRQILFLCENKKLNIYFFKAGLLTL